MQKTDNIEILSDFFDIFEGTEQELDNLIFEIEKLANNGQLIAESMIFDHKKNNDNLSNKPEEAQ